MATKKTPEFRTAVQIILVFGIISMLADMVYEGARSANSQYFELLGITATQVGLAFGIGEFIGYGLRLLAGVASDKSGRYWLFIFLGYGILIAVPFMGFAKNWHILVTLVFLERIGKALRNPAKDTILSGVAQNQVGIGFAFGLQEALDQIGAFAGPLIFTLVFFISGKNGLAEYQTSYRLLLIPFVFLMLFLFYAKRKITSGNLLPQAKMQSYKNEKLQPIFWNYTAFLFFCTVGLVNFSLIGYHLKTEQVLADGRIILLYSVAMLIDAIVSLIIGKIYDRLKEKTGCKTSGLSLLLFVPLITLVLPFFALSTGVSYVVIGMIIFGAIMGTHETIMRSAIADMTPFYKRGTGYGIFNAVYGLGFLLSAYGMGRLYDLRMQTMIVIFACISQAVAVFFFFRMKRIMKHDMRI